jgi:hypothetical protein
MGPIPLLLYIYGPRLRKASRFCIVFEDEQDEDKKGEKSA